MGTTLLVLGACLLAYIIWVKLKYKIRPLILYNLVRVGGAYTSAKRTLMRARAGTLKLFGSSDQAAAAAATTVSSGPQTVAVPSPQISKTLTFEDNPEKAQEETREDKVEQDCLGMVGKLQEWANLAWEECAAVGVPTPFIDLGALLCIIGIVLSAGRLFMLR